MEYVGHLEFLAASAAPRKPSEDAELPPSWISLYPEGDIEATCGTSESSPWIEDEIDDDHISEANKFLSSGNTINEGWKNTLVKRAGKSWDDFYKSHQSKFFLPRSYIERDFPLLLEAKTEPRTFLEVGCGTGASFLPMLDRLPFLSIVAFDLSKTAINLAREHPEYIRANGRAVAFAGNAASETVPIHMAVAAALMEEEKRIQSLSCQNETPMGGEEVGGDSNVERAIDTALSPYRPGVLLAEQALRLWYLPGGGFDFSLMLFMLSAMPQNLHEICFMETAKCLKPGGFLFFRDYGAYDAAQLRFGKEQKFDNDGSTWVRSDGTLAHFFTLERLRYLARKAGLQETSDITDDEKTAKFPRVAGGGCRYLRRKYMNRALGVTLRRVFVHAVFRKPDNLHYFS